MTDLETMIEMLDRRIATKPDVQDLSYEVNEGGDDLGPVRVSVEIHGGGYSGFCTEMVFSEAGDLLEVRAWE
jgi:hypothetical protein